MKIYKFRTLYFFVVLLIEYRNRFYEIDEDESKHIE